MFINVYQKSRILFRKEFIRFNTGYLPDKSVLLFLIVFEPDNYEIYYKGNLVEDFHNFRFVLKACGITLKAPDVLIVDYQNPTWSTADKINPIHMWYTKNGLNADNIELPRMFDYWLDRDKVRNNLLHYTRHRESPHLSGGVILTQAFREDNSFVFYEFNSLLDISVRGTNVEVIRNIVLNTYLEYSSHGGFDMFPLSFTEVKCELPNILKRFYGKISLNGITKRQVERLVLNVLKARFFKKRMRLCFISE